MRNMRPLVRWLGSIVLVLVLAALARSRSAFAETPADEGSEQPPSPPLPGSDPGDNAVLQRSTPSASDAPAQPQGVVPSEPEPYDANADTDPSALTDFHEALDVHGTWEEDPTYGRVWVPDPNEVGSDFAPYATGGHWTIGDGDEWLWVSDYDWGWAPFHYGRWARIAARRWGWIPGRAYAPAWVIWRTGYYDGYYIGWAPMPPTWYWRGGFALALGFRPPVPFFFCPSHRIFAAHVFEHIVPPAHVGAIAVRTQLYVAATASVAGGYHPLAATRNPTLGAAHVPASALPASHVAAAARAMAFARPSPRALVTSGWGASHNSERPALPTRTGPGGHSSYRQASSPAYRPPSSYSGYRGAPSFGSRGFTTPSPSPRTFGSPPFGGGSSFRSGGSNFRSAPSFRGGGARHR